MDNITKNNISRAASVFVYLETILKSSIRADEIVSIVKESHATLYYICNYELNSAVDFYRERYMEMDDPNPFSPFVLLLQQIEYMLTALCDMISFCFNYYNEHSQTHKDHLMEEMLFNQELGVYLKKILRLERELFRGGRESNKYGLQLVIIDNLTANECKTINNIKTMGLTSKQLTIQQYL